MLQVNGIRGSAVGHAGRGARDDDAAPRKAGTGRALIALQPVERAEPTMRAGPQASFLAHLIATDRQLPQTRERRRAEPAEAIAAYAAASAKAPSHAGRVLFRAT
jgi:hypothetical protein